MGNFSRGKRHLFVGAALYLGLAMTASLLGVTPVPAAARSHAKSSHRKTCKQLESVRSLDQAINGRTVDNVPTGTFTIVSVPKRSRVLYFWPPTAVRRKTAESQCNYEWPNKDVPSDFSYGPNSDGPDTLGAEIDVGYGLSTKAWKRAIAYIQANGAGQPADVSAGDVHRVPHPPVAGQAYLFDDYPGSGPPTNDYALYVFTARHNYIDIEAWDATPAQLFKVAEHIMSGGV